MFLDLNLIQFQPHLAEESDKLEIIHIQLDQYGCLHHSHLFLTICKMYLSDLFGIKTYHYYLFQQVLLRSLCKWQSWPLCTNLESWLWFLSLVAWFYQFATNQSQSQIPHLHFLLHFWIIALIESYSFNLSLANKITFISQYYMVELVQIYNY
jgi:hypothetical protein